MTRIAVIEKDGAMRALICEWLGREGHAVTGFASPPHLSEPDTTTGIVLLDLVDLGPQDADRVRLVRTGFAKAAVLGMSTRLSRSLDPRSRAARQLAVRGVVAKPCSRDELLRAIAATACP